MRFRRRQLSQPKRTTSSTLKPKEMPKSQWAICSPLMRSGSCMNQSMKLLSEKTATITGMNMILMAKLMT